MQSFSLTVDELLTLADSLPETRWFMRPLLGSGKLGMIHAGTGVGKSTLAQWLLASAISGREFLNFKPVETARALYIDGEMGVKAISQAIRKIVLTGGVDFEASSLRFLCPDSPLFGGRNMPRINFPQGQEFYTRELGDFDGVILDNLWTLSSNMSNEREFQTWEQIEPWLQQLRAAGKFVVIIHHSNKSGDMAGGIRKQTILDWVIDLKRPKDREMTDTIVEHRMEIHFTKARDFTPQERESRLVTCSETPESVIWNCEELYQSRKKAILKWHEAGVPDSQIAHDLKISMFTVKSVIRNKSFGGSYVD